MSKLTALVLAGACVTLLAASGCNRTLPAMEPYDEYKAHLRSQGNPDQNAGPAIKAKDGSETARAAGSQ